MLSMELFDITLDRNALITSPAASVVVAAGYYYSPSYCHFHGHLQHVAQERSCHARHTLSGREVRISHGSCNYFVLSYVSKRITALSLD